MAEAEQHTLLLPEDEQRRLAIGLYDHGLLRIAEIPEEHFYARIGQRSPYKLYIEDGLTNILARQVIIETMANLAVINTDEGGQLESDHVVGRPETMTSYAAVLANNFGMGLLQPRTRQSGLRPPDESPIMGRFEPGQTVAVFDDGEAEARTVTDTINLLKKAKLGVSAYYVVLDREEGVAPFVAQETGVQITPALGISTMARMLHAAGRINPARYELIASYLTEHGEEHAREAINTAL